VPASFLVAIFCLSHRQQQSLASSSDSGGQSL
jgi:hypothetical protein